MKLKYIFHVTVPGLTCGRSVGSCLAPRKVFCIYLVLCDIMNIVTNTAVSGMRIKHSATMINLTLYCAGLGAQSLYFG